MSQAPIRFFRLAALGLGLCVLTAGCGKSPPPAPAPPLPQTETKSGTAVAILVDTSGSMAQPVPDGKGQMRPKEAIAREALEKIVANTAEWQKNTPGRTLEMGIYTFSSSVSDLLPMQPFDEAKAREAVARLPKASTNTAIGRALERGYQALYQSGRRRKVILCVTDGMNTSGPSPEQVVRQRVDQTQGQVVLEFVAFDTSAAHFNFLKKVNGTVTEAADGDQLRNELGKIYEKRILAEEEDPVK